MKLKNACSPHTFHIPVMGTGFTIDTPLKVARYGISSVISLVDDVLIEQMRQYHSEHNNVSFSPISEMEDDARSKRITAYLNLLNDLILQQVSELKSAPFSEGSEITKYFEMLPDSQLKLQYTAMLAESDLSKKSELQDRLRTEIVTGTIDVNIMTKLDRDTYKNSIKLPPEQADALTALRGYAQSSLTSSIIFSAGMNRRLFSYLPNFSDFFPDNDGFIKKKIVLKVSDFRSALIQGKFLANKGLWVSEYRVESGLNCGGHAFASQGSLMGPILHEFKEKKNELIDQLYSMYIKSLTNIGHTVPSSPPHTTVTVQGGIGTAEEQAFLLNYYKVDGTGWGTPFLLVPEVTNVDDQHIEKLCRSTSDDVFLSNSSPLGIPFWNLRISNSEEVRRKRIEINKPGSPCPKGFLISNTEFTKVPICHASRVYQKRKLKEIENEGHPNGQLTRLKEKVTDKSCICHDLAGVATVKLGIDSKATPSVCCGPNIVNFSKASTLEEMIDHIYGRISLLNNSNRSHHFITELKLYVEYLQKEVAEASEGLLDKTAKYFQEFKDNLLNGIDHYYKTAEQFNQEQKEKFIKELDSILDEVEAICFQSLKPAVQ